MKPTRQVARFDSATAMLQALAASLRGRPFARLGSPPGMGVLAAGVNLLPDPARRSIYTWSGWSEALPADRLAGVRADEVARWAIRLYPQRAYPAVALGSSNGAATHLWAAMGIPWLPQTFLVPVRRSLPPDEPMRDFGFGRRWAPSLLEANPDLVLHHMHDPNQDRLMIRRMTYFRTKRRGLGPAYRDFLKRVLPPGGTILVTECTLHWPCYRVSERHVFQPGALGGAKPEEYVQGSPRVEKFLRKHGSRHHRWRYPAANDLSPESEWGFEPALLADIFGLADQHGWRVRRVSFDRPDDLSPFVADLIRWWFRRRGFPADRLLVSSFLLLDPLLTFQAGRVPFWTTFPVEPSADQLERYLGQTDPYRDMRVALFSHGVDSIGLTPPERWAEMAKRDGMSGGFLGTDPSRFPRDFAVFGRFDQALRRLRGMRGTPDPLSLQELDRFVMEARSRYTVRWAIEG